MLMHKGFSMIEWVIVFAVVLAVSAMFRTHLKRQVNAKAVATGDYLLWQRWDNTTPPRDTTLFQTDKNMLGKTLTSQVADLKMLEAHDRSVTYDTTQARAMRSVMMSTAKDQEELMDEDDANNFKADLDVSN